MFAAWRRIVLSLPALIVAGLVAVYLLFAWLAFEPLVKWAAPKYVAEKSGHVLSVERARFDPLRLSVALAGLKLSEPGGKPLLAFAELLVDFESSSLFKGAYIFKEVRLREPDVRIELRRDGSLNWRALADAFAGRPDATSQRQPDEGLPRLLIEHAVLERGRVGFEDNRVGGFQTAAEPIDLELHELSTLPDDKGSHALSVRTSFGARVKWNGVLGLNPLLASGEVTVDDLLLARVWPYLRGAVNVAPPEGKVALSLSYRLGYEANRLAVHVDKLDVRAQALAVRGLHEREAAVQVDRLALSGGRIDLLERVVSLDAIELDGGRLSITRSPDGRLDVQDWMSAAPAPGAPPAAAAPSTPTPAAAERPWRVAVGRVGLDRVACRLVDRGFESPLTAEVGTLKLGFKADAVLGPTTPDVKVDELAVTIGDVRLSSDGGRNVLLELPQVDLQRGRINLAQHRATVGRVAMTGGRTTIVRHADGELAWMKALRPLRAPAASPEPAQADAPWRYQVEEVVADGLQVAVRDEGTKPVAGVTLRAIHAEVRGLSSDAKVALPVRLQLQVQEGGRLEAQGSVVPAAPSADIRLKLVGLSLKPAQPFVARETNLVLVGGQAGTTGRLRYGNGQFRYEGEFSIDDLLLNETASGERFLAWNSLGTKRLVVTGDHLEIDQLALHGLGAKILIFKDRTTNLAAILRADAAGADQAGRTPAAAPAAPASSAKPYRVRVARIRVADGEVDFADLSLALPFGARVHKLQGHLVGLANVPGDLAQLELEGQVDEYGLARAAGQIDLFDPTAFTDIKVVFQNVEMTSLTPYSATFAGRKIASGKLSLQLEYKVKTRQLQGENQVLMDRLTLGERVESPTAANLPLDLAIAIMQDSDGKIDLGLPVSGSLDDPQFSYGSIIWKALVNVIGKVVTAPFRALGALFGGDEKTAQVQFDAGVATLLPPEREKLKNLSKVLAKRPGLALSVHAAYNPLVDGSALKERRVRRAVAAQMGQAIAADQDAGPVTTADPKTRAALEQLYSQRFGAQSLATLQGRFAQANPKAPPADAAGRLLSRLAGVFEARQAPLSAQEAAQLKGADLHALIYERLLEAEPVADDQLLMLGTSRAQAIGRELTADGVASDRIRLDTPTAATGGSRDTAATLSLSVVSRSAGASQAPAAAAQ